MRPRAAKDEALEAYPAANSMGERDMLELGRLLYVAATRARHRLHLVAHLERTGGDDDTDDAPSFREPRRGTALAVLWEAVRDEMTASATAAVLAAHAASGERETANSAADAPRVRLQRLADDWRPPGPEERVPAVAAAAAPAGLPPARVEFEWVTAAGRHAGTVVHEELERYARHGLPVAASALDARAPHWRRRLRELGLPEERLAEILARVRAALDGTLADPRGRWLFDATHREAASEYALTAVVAGQVTVATIDRTFVDADGVRWIVDFKTSRHEGGDLEGFLDTERVRYTPQLERYAHVMRLLEPGRTIRLGLYFPLHAAWREWAPGDPAPASTPRA